MEEEEEEGGDGDGKGEGESKGEGEGEGDGSIPTEPLKKKSQFKGVYWVKKNQNWMVSIWNGSRNVSLGTYDDELEGALAYDAKARSLGKKCNFEDHDHDGADGEDGEDICSTGGIVGARITTTTTTTTAITTTITITITTTTTTQPEPGPIPHTQPNLI